MVLTRRVFLAATGGVLAGSSARGQPAPAGDDFRVLSTGQSTAALRPAPSAATPVWSFDGAAPGPAIRVRQRDEVKIRLSNSLDRPVALHWQGMRIPNGMDGAAPDSRAFAAPGSGFDYRFTAADSGTYLYRPALRANAAEQMGRGMAGLLIVEEPEPPMADRECLAVIQDWRLDAKGEITADFGDATDASGAGRVGAVVTVNGRPIPETLAMKPGSRIRLRIACAVNARVMLLSFVNLRPLILAIDGQPCDAFEPVRQSIPAAPGARFDVMFDLPETAGVEASLILRGAAPPGLPAMADRPLMLFRTEGERRPILPPIASLALNPALPPVIRLQDATRADITIEGGARLAPGMGLAIAGGFGAAAPRTTKFASAGAIWRLNGVSSQTLAAKPLFSVRRGAPVSLGFINRTSFPQAIHVHGHAMRQLHLLDDGWEPYWRDTVLIPEGKTARVAFLADNPGRWLIESQIMDRATSGLATWFKVA